MSHLLLLTTLTLLFLPSPLSSLLLEQPLTCSSPGVTCDPSGHVTSLSRPRGTGRSPAIWGLPPTLRVLELPSSGLRGGLPRALLGSPGLEVLDLSLNALGGPFPDWIGRLTGLRVLNLSSNRLSGPIPRAIGALRRLARIDVSGNRLGGAVPAELGNCAELRVIRLSDDRLRGELNRFEGGIDAAIARLPELRVVWAPGAFAAGGFPADWGSCRRLEAVNLAGNGIRGEFPRSLSGCRRLKYLNLSSNRLTGELDSELPVPCMDVFDVSDNSLSGSVPEFARRPCSSPPSNPSIWGSAGRLGLGSEVAVVHDFSRNRFGGGIPSLPVATERLRRGKAGYALLMRGNKLRGPFPNRLLRESRSIGRFVLDISGNLVSGTIDSDIGSACGSLTALDASGNRITGTVPAHLALCGALEHLDLSSNRLRGRIPASIALLGSLRHLSLADNQLVGAIPASFGRRLRSLEVLDLSSNSLSGEIPSGLVALSNLSALLLHGNRLSGRAPRLPSDATVANSSKPDRAPSIATKVISSLLPYAYLRGRILESADEVTPPGGGGNGGSGFSSIEIASISSAAAIVSVLFALIIVYIYTRKCAPKARVQAAGKKEVTVFKDIGVPLTYEIVVRATGNFNASNCIGSGGFGATYKAEVAPGAIVAIKRLFVGKIQGVQQFHAEIKTLGRFHHPNLVTLIGFHVSEAEMFLIYNYLPGGNLEKFIGSRHKRPVDWRVLHKIALDVACALAYMHDECVPRILHRDVKPSNILLDDGLNAYLSDFGLARLLGSSETHATTGVAGTFGYVAPEYAMTCRVSDKADVYSYGVVLLELLSDKKALDPSFSPYGNGFNIVTWATMLLKKGKAREFFTEGLWGAGPSDDLIETLHLAIKCTVDSLTSRPTMKEVVQKLRKIQP